MAEGIEGHLPVQAQTVTGTVTASAGADLDTSLLAKEAGGNLAAVATSTASTASSTVTIATNTGSIATSTATTATNTGRIPAQGQAAMAASLPVTIANNQTAVPVSGTFYQATQPVSAAALPLPTGAALESGGNLATIATRTPALGSATSANSSPIVVANDQAAIPVKKSASTDGGATPYHLLSAANNNGTNLKASAGKICHINAANTSAAWRYVKFINKASAPAVGTDSVVYMVKIPAGGVVVEDFGDGMDFSLGIGFWIVTGVSNGDGTAVAQFDVLLDLTYK